MLLGAATLATNIKNLPPTQSKSDGATHFANCISSYVGTAQAGPTGSPGIITFAASTFASLISAMPPDPTQAWGPILANNFQTAMLASVINPSTVTNPAWTVSVTDILTLPSAPATITTLSAACLSLSSSLSQVKADATAPLPLATAFHSAITQFQFLCIGMAFIGVPTPLSLPFGAV